MLFDYLNFVAYGLLRYILCIFALPFLNIPIYIHTKPNEAINLISQHTIAHRLSISDPTFGFIQNCNRLFSILDGCDFIAVHSYEVISMVSILTRATLISGKIKLLRKKCTTFVWMVGKLNFQFKNVGNRVVNSVWFINICCGRLFSVVLSERGY